MALQPFDRLWPIQRSPRSFFNPSWEVGQWSDFNRDMWSRMRDMERQMDDQFRNFHQLVPLAPSGAPINHLEPMAFPKMQNLQIENPYVTDKDGNRKLQLAFDVRQFKPEEIQVKTQDRQLCVHARHESKTDGSQVQREYQRYYLLPDHLDPERLSSVLSPEGILSIEAPLPAIEAAPPKQQTFIPIEHK